MITLLRQALDCRRSLIVPKRKETRGFACRMVKVRAIAALVCIIFLSSLVLIPFANAGWAMFRSDPSHSSAGTGSPVLTPKLLWNYTAGGEIGSSPAVVSGVVYIGSYDDNVYAFGGSSRSSNTSLIIIEVAVAVVVIATVVFLTFRKRLKTKPQSPLTTPAANAHHAVKGTFETLQG